MSVSSSITASIPSKELAPKPPYSVFTPRQKWSIVLLVSAAGLFSPLSANSYFPAIPAIAKDLRVSTEQVNLTVTYYMIFQGLSPALFGTICDVMGRRPVYIVTFTIYIAACLALGFTEVYWLLVVLRCIQAAGSASVIAIGAGTIGDVSVPSERAGFIGVFGLGTMLGPTIGPVFGGLLAQSYGWQSIFYWLAAFAGVVYVIMIIALPETLRSLVGNGSIPAPVFNRSLISLFNSRKTVVSQEEQEALKKQRLGWKDIDILAPFRMFKEKDILCTLTFSSIVYTLFYTVITSTSTSFKSTYGLSETSIGLCFIANGAGCLLASFISGPIMNRDYRIVKDSLVRGELERVSRGEEGKDMNDLTGFPIERARLRSLPYFFIVCISACIIYGWTLDYGVYLAVPLICQFFIGLSVTFIFNNVSTLLVDLYPGKSASATAANNFYRCLLGAAGTAIIDPIISAIGAGWTFTMLSFITCLFVPLIVIEWKYGMGFRAERAERVLKSKLEGEIQNLREEKVKEVGDQKGLETGEKK